MEVSLIRTQLGIQRQCSCLMKSSEIFLVQVRWKTTWGGWGYYLMTHTLKYLPVTRKFYLSTTQEKLRYSIEMRNKSNQQTKTAQKILSYSGDLELSNRGGDNSRILNQTEVENEPNNPRNKSSLLGVPSKSFDKVRGFF